jgi:uncharacterized protein (DUF1501 family)
MHLELSPASHRLDRRAALRMLGAGAGGITLGGLLQARLAASVAGHASPDTAVIFIYLGGGPSQFETFDPKPDAPREVRGATAPIATAVAGTFFSELAPKLANIADRLSIVRSVTHEEASHIALHYVETGYLLRNNTNALKGEVPAVGTVVSRVRSDRLHDLPAYVSMPKAFAYSGPHWLGGRHQAFNVDSDPAAADFAVKGLTLASGLSGERLAARRSLRIATDRTTIADPNGAAQASGEFTERAFDLLLGSRAQTAFDLAKETQATRDAYGRHTYGQRLLMARRLVEAGVPFVAVRMGDWDDHDKLMERMPKRMAMFDGATAALVGDIRERGLARRVLVVAMGEFGRTPKVNPGGGRDHWPGANSVLLAGGTYQMGRIVGATDAQGAEPTAAAYRPENVLGMVYRHLAIDPAMTFLDHSGRPRYLLEEREPIRELL